MPRSSPRSRKRSRPSNPLLTEKQNVFHTEHGTRRPTGTRADKLVFFLDLIKPQNLDKRPSEGSSTNAQVKPKVKKEVKTEQSSVD